MISTKTSKTTIGPVLNFISYNMDLEWEAVNMDAQVTTNAWKCTRKERLLSTKKVCTALLFLMQCSPIIPGFYESLVECLGDVTSWTLCCIVNRCVHSSL